MHYLLQAEEGGETIFSDAVRAARILRESQPEHFKALSTLPVTFHKIEKGVFVQCVSTVFDVRKANQDPIIIRFVIFVSYFSQTHLYQTPISSIVFTMFL